MGFVLFISWWYGTGWVNSFKAIGVRALSMASFFSLAILLRTLFEPWKQITTYVGPNTPIGDRFRVWFDNIFSRLFGFVIRSTVFWFGAFASLLTVLYGVILAIIWPIVPMLPIVFVAIAFGALII